MNHCALRHCSCCTKSVGCNQRPLTLNQTQRFERKCLKKSELKPGVENTFSLEFLFKPQIYFSHSRKVLITIMEL